MFVIYQKEYIVYEDLHRLQSLLVKRLNPVTSGKILHSLKPTHLVTLSLWYNLPLDN